MSSPEKWKGRWGLFQNKNRRMYWILLQSPYFHPEAFSSTCSLISSFFIAEYTNRRATGSSHLSLCSGSRRNNCTSQHGRESNRCQRCDSQGFVWPSLQLDSQPHQYLTKARDISEVITSSIIFALFNWLAMSGKSMSNNTTFQEAT